MSDYGADKKPDLNLATRIVITGQMCDVGKPNVMQWTYSTSKRVQKYASKINSSNLLLKFEF